MLDTVLFASELVYIWVFVKYPFRIHDNCSNKNPEKKWNGSDSKFLNILLHP